MRPDAAKALPPATRSSCERISVTCSVVHAVILATSPPSLGLAPILPDAAGGVTHWQLLARNSCERDRAHGHLKGHLSLAPARRIEAAASGASVMALA